MLIVDLATKTIQTAIKSVVDATKIVVDGIKVRVDTIDTRTNTINNNIATILNGRVVKSVQRGTITINSTASGGNKTANVSTAAFDPGKSILLLSHDVGNSSSDYIPVKGEIISSGNLRFSAYLRASTAAVPAVSWQVIEFY